MARITVEDCLEHCENRFALVHIASRRARELFKGIEPLIPCKNREVVTALREIAAGKIGYLGGAQEEETEILATPAKKSKKSSGS
ncbi:MAG TPA: DNA-directed RNA polymerase subunit omega [bacterium]|nr:DNA-directed RNA polymerase subunit omega [bacterium]